MFQQSFLDNHAIESSPLIDARLFTGGSLIVDNEMHTLMGTTNKPLPARVTKVGDKVDVYRNLNRHELFSIKQREGALKGRVSGYAQSVVIKHPTFAIGEKSRQSILVKQSRNVHAYVRGQFVDGVSGDLRLDKLSSFLRVSYSPYVCGTFYSLERDSEGKLITSSISPFTAPEKYLYAIVNGADVILTNDILV